MNGPLPVRFFLAGEADLARAAALDPDREPAEFLRGERVWVLQTFLRLRAAGFVCELVDRAAADGLLLFHAKQDRQVRSSLPRGARPVLVGLRADNRQPLSAEFEVVQNGRFADARTRHFVPHWPQPGLRARDAGRGARVARIAYKGFLENLHPDFRGARWRDFLAARGIEWEESAREFRGSPDGADLGWSDYERVDAVVAVRPRAPKTDFSKPASKLVNAWRAGVPALIGDEYACRELRRSELDYFEVASLADAERAVDRLLAAPELHERMVENGRRRAAEWGFDADTRRWIELLGRDLPRLAAEPGRAARRAVPLGLRRTGRLAARWAAGRPAR